MTNEEHAAIMKRPSCKKLGKRLASVPPDFNELLDAKCVSVPGGFRVTLKSGVGFTVCQDAPRSLLMLGWCLGWDACKAQPKIED